MKKLSEMLRNILSIKFGARLNNRLHLFRLQISEAGMSVTELMVCICITGILAAVAIPSYISYMQQARVISLIIPRLHLIEGNIGLFYSFKQRLPSTTDLKEIIAEIDASNLLIDIENGTIVLEIHAPATSDKLYILNGQILIASPVITQSLISSWHLDGELAHRLEINY